MDKDKNRNAFIFLTDRCINQMFIPHHFHFHVHFPFPSQSKFLDNGKPTPNMPPVQVSSRQPKKKERRKNKIKEASQRNQTLGESQRALEYDEQDKRDGSKSPAEKNK
ncbi:hypothetical protein PMIN03_007969 [Paraphaeosphaeria minitans]